jgi:hypothetical protein
MILPPKLVSAHCMDPWMLAAEISKSFRAAIRKAILKLSRATALAYVCEEGGSVTCPPATYRAFLVKSIFMSKEYDKGSLSNLLVELPLHLVS